MRILQSSSRLTMANTLDVWATRSVWQTMRSVQAGIVVLLFAVPMSSAIVLGPPVPVPEPPASNWQGQPAVATDGTHSLVVWGESVPGGLEAKLFAVRTTKGVIDSPRLSLSANATTSNHSP